jgi:hypothetical protein
LVAFYISRAAASSPARDPMAQASLRSQRFAAQIALVYSNHLVSECEHLGWNFNPAGEIAASRRTFYCS